MCLSRRHADAALNGKVTAEQVQVALSRLQGQDQRTEPVEVVSAFEVPRMTFDMVQRRLFINPRTKPLLGVAEVGSLTVATAFHRPA